MNYISLNIILVKELQDHKILDMRKIGNYEEVYRITCERELSLLTWKFLSYPLISGIIFQWKLAPAAAVMLGQFTQLVTPYNVLALTTMVEFSDHARKLYIIGHRQVPVVRICDLYYESSFLHCKKAYAKNCTIDYFHVDTYILQGLLSSHIMLTMLTWQIATVQYEYSKFTLVVHCKKFSHKFVLKIWEI